MLNSILMYVNKICMHKTLSFIRSYEVITLKTRKTGFWRYIISKISDKLNLDKYLTKFRLGWFW